MRPSSLSIRHQLWALFGLFLLTGLAVLVLDEIAQHRARGSLQAMKDETLQRMRRLKAVSDGYGLDIAGTTFRVRNDLITWNEGIATVDAARTRIDRDWRALAAMPRSPRQAALFREVAVARLRADRAAATLRSILLARDIDALGRFADTELYPAIDPVTTRVKRLSDQAMVEAESLVQDDIERGRRASALRIGLSLLVLLAGALIGRRILRNAYRGIESLAELTARMRERDYTTAPRHHPRGELGEVMDAFLRMRDDVLGFETELTEQLARNEATRAMLERRERFQRALLDAAPTAIVAVDDQGRYTLFNPAAERLFGYDASEFIGRPAPSPLHDGPGHAPWLADPQAYHDIAAAMSVALGREVAPDWTAFRAAAALRTPPAETTMLHRDGRRIPLWLALGPTYDEHGELHGVVAIAMDLTERKRLEAELRESEARAREASHAKSAFLAAMSHEIRTPMIGVTGMVEILAHTRLDADQRRALNIIQSSAQALLQIIGDILDFSKIEAGRLELSPAPVDLGRVLRMAAANFTGSASSKGLVLDCSIDRRIGAAHLADALRLRQVIGNFLSNAIKFTEAGTVQVALELQRFDPDAGPLGSDTLCFRVTDTGIGVSEEAQARLFQPFAQAEGDTTRRFGGTGLGLAISRRLAELMGGEVTMESAPGLGTTMRLLVTLPRADPADVPPEPAGLADPAAFAPRRLPTVAEAERERSLVLLVDDHPTNRLVIARQLALAGYASEAAEDGEQGLAMWRSGRFALLLSDVHMPKLDGYALARAIRADEARDGRARTPIVALTAAALKGEAERCLAAGMDDYLAKPVGIPALLATLRRWLPHTAPEGAAGDAAPEPLPQLAQPPAPLEGGVLDALTGGDPRETRALLDDFLASAADDLAGLAAAQAGGDLPALARQAHKITGAARIVGAVELAEAAGQLEAAARAAELPALAPLAADIATAVDRLRLYVDERYPR
jgi:signal transduction histidine kinase/CheY-like chemotaxis protein/HPt (histidine-containing phosphotransfer) domain-containing protein